MQEEIDYLIDAKAKSLGVSSKVIKQVMAMKVVMCEEAADEPHRLVLDIGLEDIL